MLPSSKRRPETSVSDLVQTGEIEVIRDRADRTTRSPLDRTTTRRPAAPAEVAPRVCASSPPSRRAPMEFEAPRSRARFEPRHATIVPPSSRPAPALPELDDEMTRLMSHRPRLNALAAPPRRVAAQGFSSTPTPMPMALPAPSRPRDLERNARTVASSRRATEAAPRDEEVRAHPDSLRPVEMVSPDVSGRHEPMPTSITLRTSLSGRPTLTWAAALVVLGVGVGLGSSFFAKAGDHGSVATASVSAPERAAAAQPKPEVAVVEAPRAVVSPAPVAAAGAPASVTWMPVVDHPAATEAPAVSDPLAALMDTKATDTKATAHAAAPRAIYVAPTHAVAHRWTAPKAVAAPAAPPIAPAAVVAPPSSVALADLAPAPAAAAPAPVAAAPKASAKASRGAKHAADSDMQAASASDALARAQLEAALR